jgi:hypothetical protein
LFILVICYLHSYINHSIEKAIETQDFKFFLKKRLTLPLGEAFIMMAKIKNKAWRYVMILYNLFNEKFLWGPGAVFSKRAPGRRRHWPLEYETNFMVYLGGTK